MPKSSKPQAPRSNRGVKVQITTDGFRDLTKHVQEMATRAGLRGPGFTRVANGLTDSLKDMNKVDRLRGVDREGKPLAPVKGRPQPVKQVKSGRDRYGNAHWSAYRSASGPPLAPFGARSRAVRYYFAEWKIVKGAFKVAAGWKEWLDRKGKPFLGRHLVGSGKMPKRDIAGISRSGLSRLRASILNAIRGK